MALVVTKVVFRLFKEPLSMAILETALLFTAVLVSVGSALLLRSSIQKKQAAGLNLRDAEQKYRQAREARLSAEDALRRAESERREAERKLEQAHAELHAAEKMRRQAQDTVRLANDARAQAERARDVAKEEARAAIQERDAAKDAARQANEERDVAIRAREQAERERDAALARMQIAEEAKVQAEAEQDTARRERDEAILAKKVAEENTRRAIQAKFDAEEQARQAIQHAEELQKQAEHARDFAIQERDTALEQARLASERAQQAEVMQKQAEAERDKTIDERDRALEQARLADERAQQAEAERDKTIDERDRALEQARLADERAQQAEVERDAALNERDRALEQARLANERAQQAEAMQKQAEAERDAALNQRDKAIREKQVAEEDARRAKELVEKLRQPVEPHTTIDETPVAKEEHDSTINQTLPAVSESPSATTKHPKTLPPRRDDGATTPKLSISPALRPPRRGELQFHKEPTPRSTRPEIVCVQKQNVWILQIELPQEWLENHSGLQVRQNGLPLDGEEGDWQLSAPYGNVEVLSDQGIIWQVDLGEQATQPLVFKLSGDGERGHRVRRVTRGWYLLIVPEDWIHTGFEPQSVSIEGYHAYCRLVDDQREISFQTPTRGNIAVPRASLFTLKGNRLKDANEERPPLFGNTLPRIRAMNPSAWQSVETIVVGEEGRGRKEWSSVAFAPDKNQPEQDLPSEIAQWQAAWFFVRFYDENVQLIDSLDFRLAHGLKEICINASSPFPGEGGHSATRVEFHHIADCKIEPLSNVETTSSDGITIAEIPPQPTFDRTDWKIIPSGHTSTQITVLAERIWWAIGTKDQTPTDSEWMDKPLALTRADFVAISDKAVWLRLPGPRWVDEIPVGFAQEAVRSFPVRVTEQTASIPLCDFCDSESLRQIGTSHFVMRLNGVATPLAHVRVRAKCKYCPVLADSLDDLCNHIASQHLDALYPSLTYEEHRRRNPQLPYRIAICLKPGCPYYACSYSPRENVTDLILEHIRRKRHYDQDGHPRFEELFTVEKIRARLPELPIPDIRRCTFPPCTWEKENSSPADLLRHLKEEHLNALYELC
jgi:hypothetical protein